MQVPRPALGTAIAIVLLLGFGVDAIAQLPTPDGAAKPKVQFHPVKGPATIPLGQNLATLDLPAGYIFLGGSEAVALLKAAGNFPVGDELGLILPDRKEDQFLVIARFDAAGYVKDDDAGKIDADGLLKTITEATDERNAQRRQMGTPELHVTGWGERPHYVAQAHQVVWAILATSDKEDIVNYNTRILGRHGVLSLNLVTDPTHLDAHKTRIGEILANTSYNAGQRYADYKPGQDKDSGMGVTDLILGGGAIAAAAKLGIFAKMGKLLIALLLAFKKLIILAVAGVAGLFNKLRGKKNESPNV